MFTTAPWRNRRLWANTALLDLRRLVVRVAGDEATEPDRDQVDGADDLDDRERRRRRGEQRGEADRRCGDVHEPAARDPERGDEAGLAPLVDALGDDVGHGRAGHDDQRQRGGAEEAKVEAVGTREPYTGWTRGFLG